MSQTKFGAEREKPLPTIQQLEAEMASMGGFDEEKGGIVWLNPSFLHPHPNNPRKDLGDLTELTASIVKNGVMQNLTVVERKEGGYTVIIGHRRCAAAKAAGLTELPCVIAELSEREQMGIMLSENMQRVDLTVIEQAQSMQMMLDLGETVETVSDKTGLSQKTVKDRLKLNKLDQEALQKAVAKQVSLMDLLKLDKIEDENERNKVLKTAGTNNFNEAYQKALGEQRVKEKIAYAKELLCDWAKENSEISTQGGRRHRGFVTFNHAKDGIRDGLKTFREMYQSYGVSYIIDSRGVTVYSDPTEEELQKKSKDDEKRIKTNELDCVWKQIEDLYERHFVMRENFIRQVHLSTEHWKSHLQDDLLAEYLVKRNNSFYSNAGAIFKNLIGGKSLEEGLKKYRNKMDELLIKLIYSEFSDSKSRKYHNRRWYNGIYGIDYQYQCQLKEIYDFLRRFGYEMSDEEIALRDDTHPLVLKAQEIEEKIEEIERRET